ncbi:MAG: hypothetical protein JWO77_2364, partial [Ilumatobacteraceae bacterium]|nr:hypothetical protein [Ilumatobacteraceae bacterium]
AARAVAGGDAAGHEAIIHALTQAGPTGAWSGPGRSGRGIGHDLAASAALLVAARSILISERCDGLALLPVYPATWYGAGVEIHDAPTAAGALSYAIRWHGLRPALLWELAPHPGCGPVTLTIPGLDPAWSTTERRGDALLAEVTPPDGVELVREVAEHPGLQEHMRPEAVDPGSAPPVIPESGTFS